MAPEAALYKTFTYATFLFASNRKNPLQHYVNLETAPQRANCNRFFLIDLLWFQPNPPREEMIDGSWIEMEPNV